MVTSPPEDEVPPPSRLPARSELPDPLRTFDGEVVETAEDWREKRRPELTRLFRHYVYGYAPGSPRVEFDRRRVGTVLDGRATLSEVEIRFPDLAAAAPSVDLAFFAPVDGGPAPVVLGLNRAGNHAVVDDDAVNVTAAGERFGGDVRDARVDAWCVERVVERGYGLGTFHQADVDPDCDDFTDGIQPYYDDELTGPRGTEWGTLAAWAWGLQRAVDYLRTDDRVRGDEIVVTGHSRRGKAALLAGATDERVGLVAPQQSGTGGCAPARDNDQETIAEINRAFPHWFNDVFPAFAGRADRLPVDQHLLAALVAPRPLIAVEGTRDHWANPGRAYDALRAADPAYDLLGAEGTVGGGLLFEEPITAENAGDLLQYRREASHEMAWGSWEAILDFADVQFG
jgi:hypothetical protein